MSHLALEPSLEDFDDKTTSGEQLVGGAHKCCSSLRLDRLLPWGRSDFLKLEESAKQQTKQQIVAQGNRATRLPARSSSVSGAASY